jgi:hypothetical protein
MHGMPEEVRLHDVARRLDVVHDVDEQYEVGLQGETVVAQDSQFLVGVVHRMTGVDDFVLPPGG